MLLSLHHKSGTISKILGDDLGSKATEPTCLLQYAEPRAGSSVRIPGGNAHPGTMCAFSSLTMSLSPLMQNLMETTWRKASFQDSITVRHPIKVLSMPITILNHFPRFYLTLGIFQLRYPYRTYCETQHPPLLSFPHLGVKHICVSGF